jgi:transcriptional regulator with XRE-family HTH domain
VRFTPEDIKLVRKAQSLSQEKFAKQLGITREMVNKMENSKGKISAKTILRLQELYGEDLMKMISHKTYAAETSRPYRKNTQRGVPVYDIPLSATLVNALAKTHPPHPPFISTAASSTIVLLAPPLRAMG